jgi:hypothetical protein
MRIKAEEEGQSIRPNANTFPSMKFLLETGRVFRKSISLPSPLVSSLRIMGENYDLRSRYQDGDNHAENPSPISVP